MNKPTNELIKLCGAGFIHGIKIEQKQTGVDTADSFCIITCTNCTIKGKWDTYKDYLDVIPFYNGIAEVKKHLVKQVVEWKTFEEENKKELEEYKRLKKKFECA